MKIILKQVERNISSMLNGAKLPYSMIYFFHHQTHIEYLKVSVNAFLGKFINMITMFMPLKLLFVISGAKNIEVLASIEQKIGRSYYIASIFILLISLYIVNAFLEIYRYKLVAKQLKRIENKDYCFKTRAISSKVVRSSCGPFCQMLADMAQMLFAFSIIIYVNQLLAAYYCFTMFVFSLIYEQWVFSSHQTKLLTKLSIEKQHFMSAVSKINFLVLFLGVIVFVLNSSVNVIVAILVLILMRFSNGAFKSYLNCHLKLRESFTLR